jgi:hypothetical protein
VKLYGALNVAFAVLYAWFGFVLTPGRSTAFNVALALVCLILGGAGVALLINAPWGRALARAACWLLLAFAATVVVLLVVSAAILRGIYGPLGQGMSLMTLLVAALVIEAFALLPLFELRFLRRNA